MARGEKGKFNIVILMGENKSSFYEFLMKGFLLKAKQEEANLIFLTGCRIPSFCSDLAEVEVEEREYQFASIYNYADYAGADAAIIAYDYMKDFKGVAPVEVLDQMLSRIPRVYLNVDANAIDDQSSFQGGYGVGKKAIAEAVEMIRIGTAKDVHISSDEVMRQMPSTSKSLVEVGDGIPAAELYRMINEYSRKNLQMRTQAWGISFMTRDLLEMQGSIEDHFRLFLRKLTLMGMRDMYFFLIPDKNSYSAGEEFHLPKNLFFAGGVSDRGPTEVTWKNWKTRQVTKDKGLGEYLPDDGPEAYQCYLLFSGTTQYGLLLMKDQPDDRENQIYLSIQIGNLMKFVYLKHEQSETAQEMTRSLERVKETNQILSVISRYDELTKILNRRGFMEQALAEIGRHKGKQACIMFADLDHLKEINDSFGHADGDFAITTAASLMTGTIPRDAFCARIGGDEFVALVPCHDDPELEVENLRKKLKDATFAFNVTCDKPYFVELSVGYHIFECNEDVDFVKMISMSDACLYEDKQKRRASIKKKI